MNLDSYKAYWQKCGEQLYTCKQELVAQNDINDITRVFLTSYGLPDGAAPLLYFDIREGILDTPGKILDIDFDGSDNYLIFGADGSGDPLCIDLVNGNQIVYLNHDDDFTPVFVNEDMLKFASCLIKYRDFIASISNDDLNDHSVRKFSDREFEDLKRSLITIDPNCLSKGTFWSDEVTDLIWERDYE